MKGKRGIRIAYIDLIDQLVRPRRDMFMLTFRSQIYIFSKFEIKIFCFQMGASLEKGNVNIFHYKN